MILALRVWPLRTIYTDTQSWEMSWFKKIRLHLSKKFIDIIQTTWQCPDSKLIVKLIWQSEQYFGGKKVNASGISLGSWIMSAPTGRTNAEAETPLLWPPNGKSWLTAKDPDAEKDWRQEEKGTAEDETVRDHDQLSGYEFEQTPGDSERLVPGAFHRRSPACCFLFLKDSLFLINSYSGNK